MAFSNGPSKYATRDVNYLLYCLCYTLREDHVHLLDLDNGANRYLPFVVWMKLPANCEYAWAILGFNTDHTQYIITCTKLLGPPDILLSGSYFDPPEGCPSPYLDPTDTPGYNSYTDMQYIITCKKVLTPSDFFHRWRDPQDTAYDELVDLLRHLSNVSVADTKPARQIPLS